MGSSFPLDCLTLLECIHVSGSWASSEPEKTECNSTEVATWHHRAPLAPRHTRMAAAARAVPYTTAAHAICQAWAGAKRDGCMAT